MKMPAAARPNLAARFSDLRRQKRIGLLPFIPAGYPDMATTAATLAALDNAGATAIEIGFPFSDPIADGPIIQEAFTAALAKGVKVADIFGCVEEARPRLSVPLVAMVSFSVVYRSGVERFVSAASSAGFDALIIPDLPPPEAQRICDIVHRGGLETVLLVAPTTPIDRRREIARLSSAFVYYLSLTGITGERNELPADLSSGVNQLRAVTDRPICVGFGISKPRHVAQLLGVADGAIVGSAFVRTLNAHRGQTPRQIAAACAAYARELLSQVQD